MNFFSTISMDSDSDIEDEVTTIPCLDDLSEV